MRALRTAAFLALAALPAPVALGQQQPESPEVSGWDIRTARIEGAAANTREAADRLADTAARVGAAGRLIALSQLASNATELNRRVVSLGLASEVLDVPPAQP